MERNLDGVDDGDSLSSPEWLDTLAVLAALEQISSERLAEQATETMTVAGSRTLPTGYFDAPFSALILDAQTGSKAQWESCGRTTVRPYREQTA